MKLTYLVKKEDSNKTINEILSNKLNISNRLKTKLIKSENIYLNNTKTDSRNLIKHNDLITIDLSEQEDNSNILSTKMNLNIIYEDEWLLIINKPSNIATHPSNLHYENSISNGVKYYYNQIGLKKKIRPVNRLDFNTSGIVIFAKCEYIQEQLSKQMLKKELKKEYLCIITGKLENKQGEINLPIARKANSIIERCISQNGKNCITSYTVLKEFKDYSLVKCKLETGRTHQIRVHFSAIGHPLLGDTLYGEPSNLINRQALHSYQVEFIHPVLKQKMNYKCPPPYDIEKLIKYFY